MPCSNLAAALAEYDGLSPARSFPVDEDTDSDTDEQSSQSSSSSSSSVPSLVSSCILPEPELPKLHCQVCCRC